MKPSRLDVESRLARPDEFYQGLLELHRGLTEEQSRLANAKLILLLANHIGDHAVLNEALRIAHEGLWRGASGHPRRPDPAVTGASRMAMRAANKERQGAVMKLASLKHGRDGKLIVVTRDLSRAVKSARYRSDTLQAAWDDWARIEPQLQEVSARLNAGGFTNVLRLDTLALAAPLPRAYQWADGSAYVNHIELGAPSPRRGDVGELLDRAVDLSGRLRCGFCGPREDILAASEEWGVDFEAEVAVVTDDLPLGTIPAAAGPHIKLLMLVNDVSLRNLIPGELAKGFGFFQSKPACAFAPVGGDSG